MSVTLQSQALAPGEYNDKRTDAARLFGLAVAAMAMTLKNLAALEENS